MTDTTSNEFPPSPEQLGEGDPPEAMAITHGMEAVPDEGPSDEADGDLVTLDEAESESEEAQ